MEAAEGRPPLGPEEIFQAMFAQMTPQLLRQQRELLEGMRAPGEW